MRYAPASGGAPPVDADDRAILVRAAVLTATTLTAAAVAGLALRVFLLAVGI